MQHGTSEIEDGRIVGEVEAGMGGEELSVDLEGQGGGVFIEELTVLLGREDEARDAGDEAALELAEAHPQSAPALRLWEEAVAV